MLIVAVLLLTASGCLRCGTYYDAMEKFGWEKRDLLVKRVDSAREAQQEAQQQFRDALREFQTLVGYKGSELEARYERLRGEYEDSQRRADEVHTRIANVRDVANRLFQEWQGEIAQFQNAEYRRESERQLEDTRKRYQDLMAVMERASKRMDPVLSRLNDQVLFLKHNLNARALGSLQATSQQLTADVDALIKEMESSIAEATRFIEQLDKQPAS
jgi:ElaB/YqjD/DUF883 family membrane-anchored ribosome-binding protein